MSKGKAKVTHIAGPGMVGFESGPSWDFLYVASKIKHPNYNIGDRVPLPDGRVFRYAKCGSYTIPSTERAVQNNTVLVACKTAGGDNNAVTLESADIGAKSVNMTFTAATLGNSQSTNAATRTGVVAKDELRGGFISFRTGAFPSIMQTRGIIGNTAVAATDTSMTIYLDAALNSVLTAGTSTCEILANPYGNVGVTGDQWVSKVGMPNVTATIGQYLWLQTWGPLRIAPTANLGLEKRERQFMFDAQGCVVPISGVLWKDASAGHDQQIAGYLMERTYQLAGSAAPFINLQINP